MPDEPWDSYRRDALRSGLSYPVGRPLVEASLRAAGVHLLALGFARSDDNQTDTVLLRAVRYSDIGNTYDLPRERPTVHASS
ncbi:hypothetical protein ACFPIJ_40980 [Dactylosporangium cerinum]|uniref:Uncharacterized protein n=1 Tax=Dactylosporangium cerinum TaxID=1434730 RepID=A0ABV9WA41_9ACTN